MSLCSLAFPLAKSLSYQNTIRRYLYTTTATANMPVQRITMFKVAASSDIPLFLEQYQTLAQEQKRVSGAGREIINHVGWQMKAGWQTLHPVNAHQPVNDPRTQGYNVLAHTVFASLEDVKYYDEKCEAHAALKAFAKDKVAGPPMAVMWETSSWDARDARDARDGEDLLGRSIKIDMLSIKNYEIKILRHHISQTLVLFHSIDAWVKLLSAIRKRLHLYFW
jgi:hypothetical protein